MRSRAAALVLVLGAISACSAGPPPSGYAEGRVDVSNNIVTLDQQPLPGVVVDSVSAQLKNLEGFEVGVAYSGSSASIVSPVTDEWRQVTALTGETRQPTEVAAAYQNIDRRLLNLGTGGAPDHARLAALVKSYSQLEKAAYDAAGNEPDPRRRQALMTLGSKSGYHMMVASYPTSHSSGIDLTRTLGSSLGTASILDGTAIAGSGFLVASNWLVTNRHVAAGLGNLKNTRIAFTGDPSRKIGARECAVVERKIAPGQSPLDLAALRFNCAARIPPTWVLKLADRYAERGDLLYIHGFSTAKDKRDFVYPVKVRYPYRVTESLKNGLRSELTSPPAIQLFDRFYLRCDPPTNWCYFTSEDRWGQGQNVANIPTMGFDSDTKPGNSGSPVIAVDDHQVVGVLFAGAGNPNVNQPYSFERHEAAIPSPIVLAWLKGEKVLP